MKSDLKLVWERIGNTWLIGEELLRTIDRSTDSKCKYFINSDNEVMGANVTDQSKVQSIHLFNSYEDAVKFAKLPRVEYNGNYYRVQSDNSTPVKSVSTVKFIITEDEAVRAIKGVHPDTVTYKTAKQAYAVKFGITSESMLHDILIGKVMNSDKIKMTIDKNSYFFSSIITVLRKYRHITVLNDNQLAFEPLSPTCESK